MQKQLLSLSTAIALFACNRLGNEDLDAAELAADSSEASQAEAAMLASFAEGSESSAVAPATPEGVARFIAMNAPNRYSPAGCASATQNVASVSLVFVGCTGPRGLRTVDGKVDVTASAGAGGSIVIVAKSDDIHIGGATLDIDATATYVKSGSTASLAVSTKSSGTGPLGGELAHTGDYTATWTPTCIALDGAWSTSAGDRMRSTTVDVMRCVNECPNGTVTRTTVNNRVITITFDGTDTAQWSTSGGRSGTFDLPCR